MRTRFTASLLGAALLASCAAAGHGPAADLLLVNARVYTLAWDDPGRDGTPAPNAPYGVDGWHPDADTVASSYLPETPAAQQDLIDAPSAAANALQRIDFRELGESKIAGNGVTGHDETSEPWTLTFTTGVPTPGTP